MHIASIILILFSLTINLVTSIFNLITLNSEATRRALSEAYKSTEIYLFFIPSGALNLFLVYKLYFFICEKCKKCVNILMCRKTNMQIVTK